METFVLLHGASSDSWYWHLVRPELEARGHQIVAPDLPTDDDSAGPAEYAGAVVEAVGDRQGDLVLAAQSLAGVVVPLVCQRLPVRRVVMVAAMVPTEGESPGQWWANTGFEQARKEYGPGGEGIDVMRDFFHDVPPDVTAEAFARGERYQSGAIFDRPYPMPAWPNVPTRFVLCREDRFFPAPWLRQVVRDRLGIEPEELDSGHLPALSHPKELADKLLSP